MSRVDGTNRPPLPENYLDDSLEFQLLECVSQLGPPSLTVSVVAHDVVPILKLYGCTRTGHSVLVHVYNFEPYLFVEAPLGWLPSMEDPFRAQLNAQLEWTARTQQTVVRIETCQKQSLMYYTGGVKRTFLKIVVQVPQHIVKVKALVTERGIEFSPLWDGVVRLPTFESNVLFPLRFLVDCDVGGCNWVSIKQSGFVLTRLRTSTAQIEVDSSFETIESHVAVGQYMDIAPFVILSIDIECMGRKGFFPEASVDPVIQIAAHVCTYGNACLGEKTIFTLDSCAPIAGADVRQFSTEADMLVSWAAYLVDVDPDILTGYNVTGFDFPYLLNRATALGISSRFHYWSRVLREPVVPREKTFSSKQIGNRVFTEVAIEGRVVMDVMIVVQRDHKLRSYTLNAVAQHFLNEQKEDVHHSIIGDLHRGTDETRRRLAVYCLKDAYLPLRIMDKLAIVVNYVEMSRVTGVPIGWLLERGQGIKVFSQMLRRAKKRDLLFPVYEYQGSGEESVGYTGATVITPTKGFYNRPVATLDFASLYPSIMMAHNLCYSTLIRPGDEGRYAPDVVTLTPSGSSFVTGDTFRGILPEILVELLSARKAAKKAMAVATDPMQYAVLNGRQLALKVSANSVYGFTGAKVGKLPCLEISASVTSFGRVMIEQTKRLVEARYPSVRVVYGDTDSVMIECASDDNSSDEHKLNSAMAFGVEAAAYVSTQFKAPIKLEFEKVYFPFLLMNKKRYAGLLWTNTKKWDKLDAKGIETVRRDNCQLIAFVISGVLNRILIQRSVEAAIEFVKGTVSDLLMNRVDISQLVISKAFTKLESEYTNKQAHIALVERMRRRDPASAPAVGDRVTYVIIKAAKGAKAFECSEDPIYVLENNIPIDVQYYLEHCLTQPLMRVFEAVMDDPRSLVRGEHTRHVVVKAPTKCVGGLMKFVSARLHCVACRTPIESGALCEQCEPTAPDVLGNLLAMRNHHGAIFSRVWTQCQQCQGSLLQEVLCSSRDCPVFYMRRKVQKDLQESHALVERFGVVTDW